MKKFINTNSTIIDKYKLNNYFDYNFQLGFKQLYKKCLLDKFNLINISNSLFIFSLILITFLNLIILVFFLIISSQFIIQRNF